MSKHTIKLEPVGPCGARLRLTLGGLPIVLELGAHDADRLGNELVDWAQDFICGKRWVPTPLPPLEVTVLDAPAPALALGHSDYHD